MMIRIMTFTYKMLKHLAIVLIYFTVTLTVTLLSTAYASDSLEDISGYKLLIATEKFLGIGSGVYGSAVSSELTSTFGMLINIGMYMIPVTLSGYIIVLVVKIIISKTMKAQFIPNMCVKLLLLIVLGVLSAPSMSTKKEVNGYVYYTPIYISASLSFFRSVIEFSERSMQVDDQRLIDVEEFKLLSPNKIMSDFESFSKNYLKTNFENEEMKIKISSLPDQYKSNVVFGGKSMIYKFKKNSEINYKGQSLGIDMISKEEFIIKDYFQSMIDHSAKLKKSLENTTIGSNTSGTNILDVENIFDFDTDQEKAMTSYCPTIYTDVPLFMDRDSFNYHISIAAYCASESFMKKHYENEFYNYSDVFFSKRILNTGSSMYFGFGVENETMTLKSLIDKTTTICKSGYLACSAAVNYAFEKEALNNFKLGIMTSPARIFSNIFQVRSSVSESILTSKVISFSDLKSNTFYETKKASVDFLEVKGLAISGDYNKHIKNSLIEGVSFSKIQVPTSMDDMFTIITGENPVYTYQRLFTCIKFPSEIKNGFRCQRITNELSSFALNSIETAVRLYIIKNLFRDKKSNETASLGKQAKDVVKTAVAGAGATMFLSTFDKGVFENSNYSGETIKRVLIAQMMVKSMGGDLSAIITVIANILFTTGVMILFMLLTIPFHILDSIMKVFVIVMSRNMNMPQYLFQSIHDDGMNGVIDFVKKYVDLMIIFVVLSAMMLFTVDYMDILLSSFVGGMLNIFEINSNTITEMIQNIPKMIFSYFAIFMVLKEIIGISIDRVVREFKPDGL